MIVEAMAPIIDCGMDFLLSGLFFWDNFSAIFFSVPKNPRFPFNFYFCQEKLGIKAFLRSFQMWVQQFKASFKAVSVFIG